jgi:elongation factor Ts
MTITADQVRQLRERTGAGMMECKKALQESAGDFEKAIDALRTAGLSRVAQRSGRDAAEGRIESYIHPGNRVGVLIELNSETDFVARTDEFGDLARNLAMQAAAAGAEFVRREEVPAERVERERAIIAAQVAEEGKPEAMRDKIVAGKLDRYFAEICLLEQPYIRDDKMKVSDVVAQVSAKTGENIVVRRFVRFKLGQD